MKIECLMVNTRVTHKLTVFEQILAIKKFDNKFSLA